MVRPKQTSRVSKPAPTVQSARTEDSIPSLRKRKPAVFWFVVLGTIAMVVPLFLSGFLLLLEQLAIAGALIEFG